MADPLATTRMACEPALMAQERWVIEMLDSRPRLELSGPYLALHWGEDERWWLGLEQEGVDPAPSGPDERPLRNVRRGSPRATRGRTRSRRRS